MSPDSPYFMDNTIFLLLKTEFFLFLIIVNNTDEHSHICREIFFFNILKLSIRTPISGKLYCVFKNLNIKNRTLLVVTGKIPKPFLLLL